MYVEAVISAFWQAAQEGAALDWPAVLSLCSWADQQAEAELPVRGDRLWRQWESARMASLRLLEAGFAASAHEIPAELGTDNKTYLADRWRRSRPMGEGP